MTVTSTEHQPLKSNLPDDHLERIYAGVLGKIIGVYLGRPFEGWTYERITAELGDIQYYVHDKLGVPLIVNDDDITGTFAFLRAIEEQHYSPDFTAADVGQTWLNVLIENRTVLWWGGYGMSTEHTAYLNLKSGISAPQSGSVAQNGVTVAEQIGAQIFIDGWAMLAPGDPALAASFAGRAARVSHDGEAVYAAQALAAMEAQAFVTRDIQALLDTALSVIPEDSLVAKLIHDLRRLHTSEPDWRRAREFVAAHYGYDRYQGNCHVIPNHALILLGLLYGEGDFQKSMLIVNTSGWDTDCNSGNLGCLLGIMNGLEGLETGPDWRTPVADRLYLPTAEGGRAITDAAREALWVTNLGRAIRDEAPLVFKDGARFHFELPGSVQGFTASDNSSIALRNVTGHSAAGQRSFQISYQGLALGRSGHVSTPTFSPLEALGFNGRSAYDMIASPTLYPGQVITARLEADVNNAAPVAAALAIEYYDAADQLAVYLGPSQLLQPGEDAVLSWQVPDLDGSPVATVGVRLDSRSGRQADGSVYLDWLTWSGMPTLELIRPQEGGTLWRHAWVSGADTFTDQWGETLRLIQNHGRGLVSQGTREWTDYRAEATLTPHLSAASGLGIRVQGMRRYYALLLVPGAIQLVKVLGHEQVLAEVPLDWTFDQTYGLTLEAVGTRLRGWVDGQLHFDVADEDNSLEGGAVGLIVERGMLTCQGVRVEPV